MPLLRYRYHNLSRYWQGVVQTWRWKVRWNSQEKMCIGRTRERSLWNTWVTRKETENSVQLHIKTCRVPYAFANDDLKAILVAWCIDLSSSSFKSFLHCGITLNKTCCWASRLLVKVALNILIYGFILPLGLEALQAFCITPGFVLPPWWAHFQQSTDIMRWCHYATSYHVKSQWCYDDVIWWCHRVMKSSCITRMDLDATKSHQWSICTFYEASEAFALLNSCVVPRCMCLL